MRIDNWVEDEATDALAGTQRSVVDDGAPFFCTSNQQLSYTAAGKQGADLLKSVSIAKDDGYAVPSRTADTLLRHGDFSIPRIQCLATTYNLVHGPRRSSAVRVDSERHTQELLWKVRVKAITRRVARAPSCSASVSDLHCMQGLLGWPPCTMHSTFSSLHTCKANQERSGSDYD